MSTYAVSDLHGCYEQWLKIRNKLKDNDTLYVLGDCIDRQAGGLGILQEAIEDPRCIVLCGNHEDMMMEALEEEGDDHQMVRCRSSRRSCGRIQHT